MFTYLCKVEIHEKIHAFYRIICTLTFLNIFLRKDSTNLYKILNISR